MSQIRLYILREKAEIAQATSQPELFINYHVFGSRKRGVVTKLVFTLVKHVGYSTTGRT